MTPAITGRVAEHAITVTSGNATDSEAARAATSAASPSISATSAWPTSSTIVTSTPARTSASPSRMISPMSSRNTLTTIVGQVDSRQPRGQRVVELLLARLADDADEVRARRLREPRGAREPDGVDIEEQDVAARELGRGLEVTGLTADEEAGGAHAHR